MAKFFEKLTKMYRNYNTNDDNKQNLKMSFENKKVGGLRNSYCKLLVSHPVLSLRFVVYYLDIL